MTRRTFTRWIAASVLLPSVPLTARPTPDTSLWKNIGAALQVILPGGGGAPSAASIDAAGYLFRTMRHPSFDHEIRDFIVRGVPWLDTEAETAFKKHFAELEASERDAVLRIIVNDYRRGEAWVSTLVSYTLEALLSDPLYGANTDEAGWEWLGLVPGLPRPQRRYIHGD
jgi:gluconate 2-dehydrogenase gamma chain